jgi:hypothetical protein
VAADADAPVRALAPNSPTLLELEVMGTGGRGEYLPEASMSPDDTQKG